MRSVAAPSAVPIEVRLRLWTAAWEKLLRPLPDEDGVDAIDTPDPTPPDDERGDREAAA
jgi:hypothetical protein